MGVKEDYTEINIFTTTLQMKKTGSDLTDQVVRRAMAVQEIIFYIYI
jgi:hypothetical protein